MSFELFHCEDSFAKLAGQAADVVITDPPYAEEVQANMIGSLPINARREKVTPDFAPLTDRGWVLRSLAVTSRWLVTFCGVEDFGRVQALALCMMPKNSEPAREECDRSTAEIDFDRMRGIE